MMERPFAWYLGKELCLEQAVSAHQSECEGSNLGTRMPSLQLTIKPGTHISLFESPRLIFGRAFLEGEACH